MKLIKENELGNQNHSMKNKRLEILSDEVRRGNPIGMNEAIEVIGYQTEIQKIRKERTQKRLMVLKSISAVVCSAIGGMAIVAGEVDDSPGLGGIGIIIIAVTIYLNTKLVNKK